MNKVIAIAILLVHILSPRLSAQSDIPSTPAGLVERIENFPTDSIATRHIDIWTPEDYDKNGSYPVIYAQDGQMLFDSTATWNQQEWKLDETISELIQSGTIPPCIVVAIHSVQQTRHADYFPQSAYEILPDDTKAQYAKEFTEGAKADAYLKFIVDELRPFINKSFAVDTTAANTYIMGSSMGGLIAMYATINYPEVFSGAICMSTHWIGGYTDYDNPVPASFLHILEKNTPDPATHRFYFDHGTEGLDKLYGKHQQRVDVMMADKGYQEGQNYMSKVYEGADHNEKAWAARLSAPLSFMLSKK